MAAEQAEVENEEAVLKELRSEHQDKIIERLIWMENWRKQET